MAIAVNVAGLTPIYVGTGVSGALEFLGYTRDGANHVGEAAFLNVPGDEHGGQEGTPIEVQYLGEVGRVRLELTKYDKAVFAKVRARCLEATDGTPYTAGTLMLANSKFMRLLANAPSDPHNYPCAIPRGTIELNTGTKFSMAICEFECHKHPTSGVLRDNTVTGVPK